MKIGTLVATKSIVDKMCEDNDFAHFINDSVNRYKAMDWGDTCDEDKEANSAAIKNDERILAVYKYPKTEEEIWIITEWDRSVTTILFPHEY